MGLPAAGSAAPAGDPIIEFVLVSDFDYQLPEELIAREPLPDRAASRLLHLCRSSAMLTDRGFRDLPELLRSDDLVVFNNTRVFPARLYGRRSGHQAQPVSHRNAAAHDFLTGKVEVLLTRECSADPPEWEALVRPGRKIGVGERLFFGDGLLEAEVINRGEFGERRLRFLPVPDFFARIEQVGHVPLPPYLGREDRPEDRERYQTVYARERGSVAAPTAGLHFTAQILEDMRKRGIETAEVTLHVGLGTFQPVHAERVEDHLIHREWYEITPDSAGRINQAMADHRRVVAVGTTTVRTLEHAASQLGGITSGRREADLFIYPGYRFRVVGAMLTNFHLPKSTLLMLVSAFAGREFVMEAYRHAIEQHYRFYSYGDCMLME
jgi:S-adenosylmethionine:tRNA ribosyltransferase-isomerase